MAIVKLFGWAKDLAGTAETALAVGEYATTDDVWKQLLERFPSLAPHRNSFLLAVNREYAAGPSAVHDQDEIAVIPPVSGG